MNKLIEYSIYCLIAYFCIFFIVYPSRMTEKTVDIVFKIFQTLAIIFGGIFAYIKFILEKRQNNVSKLLTSLILFQINHEKNVIVFNHGEMEERLKLMKYEVDMIQCKGSLMANIGMLIYVPEKIRLEIMNILNREIKNKEDLDYISIETNKTLDDIYKLFYF